MSANAKNPKSSPQPDQSGPSHPSVPSPSEPAVGNTVRVTFDNKPFEGIVIARKGKGAGRTFTVRKIASHNVGVERIFPLHSPLLTEVETLREGKVRRSKLYYLRDRTGRAATRVKAK